VSTGRVSTGPGTLPREDVRTGSVRDSAKSSVAGRLWIATLAALVPVVCLAIPMYVIRPFRPQDAGQLAFALTVRGLAPWVSTIFAIVVLVVAFNAWPRVRGFWRRAAFVSLSLVSVAGAVLTHVNIFEIMFHPYPAPVFGDATSVQVDADDKVLSVQIDGEARAYPIRTMGYHHIVNDTVGGQSIAVSYCTLCHTGLVWSRVLDGRTLTFRLAGINNGNALLRDEQTSSIWQQSTGHAIFGPLKGKQLGLVHSDELIFSTWRKEQPKGLVLRPEAQFASKYDPKDWEKHVEKTKTVIDTARSGIAAHELMIGVLVDGRGKAFPVKAILAAKLVQDRIAGEPVLLVVGTDGASIRVFRAGSGEQPMTFVPVVVGDQRAKGGLIQDAETGSVWNFQGCAIEGKLVGQCLKPVDANKDYWFDWMNHHPDTTIFRN
jgi:hypothetical protein